MAAHRMDAVSRRAQAAIPAEDGPADEMLLAEMIAGARGHGAKFHRGNYWADEGGVGTSDFERVAACCAFGALALARGGDPCTISDAVVAVIDNGGAIISGNDNTNCFVEGDSDSRSAAWTIGAAYREEMLP